MARRVEAIGTKLLARIIQWRSRGETISQTAHALGLRPWHVSYLTRFIKVCISNEEYQWLYKEADRWGYGSVGELVMECFNQTYEKHFVPLMKRGRRKVSKIKAAS